MEKNEYLCNVNKSEEQQFAIIISQLNSEKEERRAAQKKAELLEQKNSVLQAQNEEFQRQLRDKVDEMSASVKQIAQILVGNGVASLSETLTNSIIGAVREEYEERGRRERAEHEKEMRDLKDLVAVQLSAKDNEIARLKAIIENGKDNAHGTTTDSSIPDGMDPEDRIKQLEQQKNKFAIDAYGQGTESEKYNHGCQNPVKADDLDLEGADVPEERCVEIALKVNEDIKQRKNMLGVKKPRNLQPLEEAAFLDKDSQIILTPEGVPDDAEELDPEERTRTGQGCEVCSEGISLSAALSEERRIGFFQ